MTAAGMSVPTVDRQQLGAAAEDAALALLIEQGCSLLARNVRYKFGELDLVMRDAGTLAFVEVRFRRNSRFGGAAMSVDVAKRRKVARAAQAWLGSHRQYAYAACRFEPDQREKSECDSAGELRWLPRRVVVSGKLCAAAEREATDDQDDGKQRQQLEQRRHDLKIPRRPCTCKVEQSEEPDQRRRP